MKGNRTNHPSRAGVPLKDGRTAWLPGMRITPDALTKLKAIVASRKVSRSDYLQEKIEEDYKNIQQGESDKMNSREIFEKLMRYRDESVRGNKMLDEYFDAIMYSVAKVLDLTNEQAHQLAGEEMESVPVATPNIELNPAEYEITDGHVGGMGKTYTKATAETLAAAISEAMKLYDKSYNDIAIKLMAGAPIEWCKSPNYHYDHSLGFIRRKRNLQRIQTVECTCGHTVPTSQVMTTSSGTSCPDCYDRMSN